MVQVGQIAGWMGRSQEAEAEVRRLRVVIVCHAARLARLELLPEGCDEASERRMLEASYRLLDELDGTRRGEHDDQ